MKNHLNATPIKAVSILFFLMSLLLLGACKKTSNEAANEKFFGTYIGILTTHKFNTDTTYFRQDTLIVFQGNAGTSYPLSEAISLSWVKTVGAYAVPAHVNGNNYTCTFTPFAGNLDGNTLTNYYTDSVAAGRSEYFIGTK